MTSIFLGRTLVMLLMMFGKKRMSRFERRDIPLLSMMIEN